MLPINAQPLTDSGPALRKSPQANDIKILLLRHTNDAPRYCTSGARPSMLAILHLPSLEQYGSHYINPAKRPLLIRSNPLIQTCPIDHGKSFNKDNLSKFSLFCFETLPRSMCAFSLYSLSLKKKKGGGTLLRSACMVSLAATLQDTTYHWTGEDVRLGQSNRTTGSKSR